MFTFKEIESDQSQAFNQLIKNIESESHFMLHDPGERKTTDEDQKIFIERIKQNSMSKLFIACNQDHLVGFIIVIGEQLNKRSHSRYIAMGVLAEFKGMMIGSHLMASALAFCDEQKVSRIELTVAASNLAAINLYKKFGFDIEGTKRNSLIISGEKVDEYYMSRIN